MGKIILDMAMSLDGFIAGMNDEDGGLHHWYFEPAPGDQQVIDEIIRSTGAMIMGRRTYNIGDQHDGFEDNPYPVPHFVLTHKPPAKPAKGATQFVFVTDGIESALAQAQAAAGDKDVVIGGGAKLAQQFVKAGLLDEIQIHLVPVLIGDGKRLFEDAPLELDIIRAIESPGVTHIHYRVIIPDSDPAPSA